MLLGVNVGDDAGVYLLHDDLALVQTVDFFTPVVDDPYAFGQIAAANALSDVYCMGARPITALNIIAFPETGEPGLDALNQILRGGLDKAAEAGVAILGGHSVDDNEPKYGMAVTGTVHPDRIWTKQGAKPGDKILLTKPLGTGIIATAIKRGKPTADQVKMLIRTAGELNKTAAETALSFDVHAATDVTGFGLVNHLLEILTASNVAASLSVSALPILQGIDDLIAAGMVPGGSRKNLAFAQNRLDVAQGLAQSDLLLAADAQTSGGLLLAVPSSQAEDLVAALHSAGVASACIVAEVFAAKAPRLRLEP